LLFQSKALFFGPLQGQFSDLHFLDDFLDLVALVSHARFMACDNVPVLITKSN
jgi:hypothetical protein